MSEHEAKIYVDEIVETLVSWGIITQNAYGNMTEAQRQTLAESIVAKSEE